MMKGSKMIDADVMRLRQLRNAALRARALAQALNSDSAGDNALCAKSAVIFWNIARVATGRLRAHPYLSYQKGPGRGRELADSAIASITAFIARQRGRNLDALASQLRRVAREVDDARAVTRSPDLSDSLGRSQLQLRHIARHFAGMRPRLETVRADAQGAALKAMDSGNWPYLAI
jgi:hypothetical protein